MGKKSKRTEFQNLYRYLRHLYLQESKLGLHGRGGLGTVIANVTELPQATVSMAKLGRHDTRLRAHQYLALSERFDVSVDRLVRISVGPEGI